MTLTDRKIDFLVRVAWLFLKEIQVSSFFGGKEFVFKSRSDDLKNEARQLLTENTKEDIKDLSDKKILMVHLNSLAKAAQEILKNEPPGIVRLENLEMVTALSFDLLEKLKKEIQI